MLVGYARISTQEQTLALQEDALHNLGCEPIFTDTASGALAILVPGTLASPGEPPSLNPTANAE